MITDLEDSIKSKTVKIWESWPDPDMYQFKESDAYGGYEVVSFIMTPEKKEFQNFINELKKEYHELIEGKNLKLKTISS